MIPYQEPKTNETAYKFLVRAVLEYWTPVLGPYYQNNYINRKEIVHWRAVMFVLGQYHNTSSPAEMLQQLEWDSLKQRHIIASLTMYYKIPNSLITIIFPSIVMSSLSPKPKASSQ